LDLPRAVLEAERKAEEAFTRLKSPPQPTAEEPAPPATQDPPPPPPPQPAPTPGDEPWEARYRSLHGKYNAEIPRLNAALKERDADLSTLREEVDALKRAKDRQSLVKPEEIQEFGEPLVDLIRRAAREEVGSKDHEISELKSQLKSIKSTSEQSTETTFYEKLASVIPDWMAINDDPEFHTWLAEHDELTGYQRQELLSQAEKRKDSNRVARFFDAFKKTQSKTQVAAVDSLESQVPPVTSRADAPPPGKKIWTRGEIADFYARDKRGEYSAERSAVIEKDIQEAVRDRRVR
jgi:hypothetical protein